MPRATADLEQLATFTDSLQQLHDHRDETMNGLQPAFNGVSDTWQDQGHEQFQQEVDQNRAALRNVLETIDRHKLLVARKWEKLHDYTQMSDEARQAR